MFKFNTKYMRYVMLDGKALVIGVDLPHGAQLQDIRDTLKNLISAYNKDSSEENFINLKVGQRAWFENGGTSNLGAREPDLRVPSEVAIKKKYSDFLKSKKFPLKSNGFRFEFFDKPKLKSALRDPLAPRKKKRKVKFDLDRNGYQDPDPNRYPPGTKFKSTSKWIANAPQRRAARRARKLAEKQELLAKNQGPSEKYGSSEEVRPFAYFDPDVDMDWGDESDLSFSSEFSSEDEDV
jgi:hypothetical protein